MARRKTIVSPPAGMSQSLLQSTSLHKPSDEFLS